MTGTDTAWIFPGQGSQKVGMGRALAEQYGCARAVFATVDEALDFPLSHIIFEGPDQELVATRNQQPALLATSIAYLKVMQEREVLPEPCFVAGHSLGEYTALVAAGSLDLADAARLVRRRGELMEQHGHGGMIAVIGLADDALTAIAGETGVEVANYNAPGQITLSGRTDALQRATARAKEAGARRVIPLAVNGAFHSSLMDPVVAGLRPMIESMTLRHPSAPLVSNVDASLLTDPDDLREELLAQITASVQWVNVVRRAADGGVRRFFEIGPGKVLGGLVTRILRDAETYSAEALLAS